MSLRSRADEPLGSLRRMQCQDCTGHWAHSKTPDLGVVTRAATVLVVAAGVRGLVRGDHVSPGTIVIDVGIHPNGDTIVGDVDAPSVEAKLGDTGGLSPVPGGVGPMTSAISRSEGNPMP